MKRILLGALCLLFVSLANLSAQEREPREFGPFPLPGPIYGPEGESIGVARVYPRYVEIYDEDENFLARIGILVERGIARIHMVLNDGKKLMVGYANKGVIYDSKDRARGTYFWTPTYSYAYTLEGKRAGHTKCIAWPRVCSVGVAGFLLKLFAQGPGQPPAKGDKDAAKP